MKTHLIWKHYLVLIGITLLGLFLISRNVSRITRNSYKHEKKISLEQLAKSNVSLFADPVNTGNVPVIQQLCEQFDKNTQLRLTIIDPEGTVLGDSRENPSDMENHFNRPEFQMALTKGQTGSDIRVSKTLGIEMMYVAVPIMKDGHVISVLRTSVNMSKLQSILDSILGQMIQFGVITAFVFLAAGLIFTIRFNRHMVSLCKGAERFAHGDLSHRIEVSNIPDIAEVSQSMNKMAEQLVERIQMITSQKNEQQAMLSSMVEGVVAVNKDGRILSINNAAAEMLQTSPEKAPGRTVEEVIRNKDLQFFVRTAMDSEIPVESQITLHEHSHAEQFVQAHGSALKNELNEKIGVLVVLNDVTHIRKLEQVRRDFVANVSHELKTPVTSIKGFIETLLDGAVHDPDDTRRFLTIIERQTNRLNSIIEDLLTLSRIEQHDEEEHVTLEPARIRAILVAAASLCLIQATEKSIEIEIDCDPEIIANVNASLLEQAIVNLVDNAIKYSNPGGHVRIEVKQDEQHTYVRVIDNGCGIAQEHLHRLFERFYRVDKARSRKLGGTGLGLAIVKHIAQSHKGSITVESEVGSGTTFTIQIPSSS